MQDAAIELELDHAWRGLDWGVGARIILSDAAAITADWSFAVQVGQAVIANADGWDGGRLIALGRGRQLPSSKNTRLLEHEIPMLAVAQFVV